MDEMKTYRVTLSTYLDSSERLRSRLRKFFRKRAKGMVEPEPGQLNAEMRNGSQVYCKLKSHSGNRISCEPIAELILVTASSCPEAGSRREPPDASYLDYSLRAVKKYSDGADLYIRIEVEERTPKK